MMLHSIPWYIVLLQGVPETFLVILLGFKLFDKDVSHWNALFIAVISAILSYFIRSYITVFGLHTVLLLLLISIITVIVTKMKLSHGFIGVLTGILLAGVTQSLTAPLILSLLGKGFNDLKTQPELNIYAFLPCAVIMTLLYFVVKRRGFYLLEFENHNKDDRVV